MEENNKQIHENDEFSIENGFIIDDSGDNYPTKNRHSKKKNSGRKNIVKTIIWIVSIVVVSVGIAIGIIYVGADYLGLGFGRGGSCVIEVEKGSGTAAIANELKEAGAVKCPFVFRVYTKLKHYDGKFKYGVYSFSSELGYESIANMLMTEGAKAESVSVTIVEGSSVDDIAKLLDEKGVCKKSDFLDEVRDGKFDYDFVNQIPTDKVYYRLEGYLFPDTYDFYNYDSKECAHLAVDKMLSNLDKKLKEKKININNITVMGKNYTFHEIMSMASIVEMEAGGSKDEMSKVAAVFYNRLNSDDYQTLGSSPTRKYPYGNGKYNTYECAGLPVGPLCSAGIDSIVGAVNPEENFDYYYFVTDASMKFYYNKTITQHNSTIAKLKAAKNWIYEE